jgi:hypothetical protein
MRIIIFTLLIIMVSCVYKIHEKKVIVADTIITSNELNIDGHEFRRRNDTIFNDIDKDPYYLQVFNCLHEDTTIFKQLLAKNKRETKVLRGAYYKSKSAIAYIQIIRFESNNVVNQIYDLYNKHKLPWCNEKNYIILLKKDSFLIKSICPSIYDSVPIFYNALNEKLKIKLDTIQLNVSLMK